MIHTHGTLLLLIIISILKFSACESSPISPLEKQVPAKIKSRINRQIARNDGDNDIWSRSTDITLPSPQPSQTLGDFLDNVDNILDSTSNDTLPHYASNSQLNQRNFVRTGDYRKSVWFDGTEHYNISISKCIQFSETIGTWTAHDGSTASAATMTNITSDLATHFRNKTDLSNYIKSRLLANAELAASEAEASLGSTVCNYEQPPGHDELRKLLAPTPLDHLNTKFLAVDGYWTGVLMSMGAGAAVGGTLYKGFYNHNASAENVALTCFTAAGLIFTRGVIERLYMNGLLRYTEANVIAAFTAWFRWAVASALSMQQAYLQQVGADQTKSGCLEEIVIESSVESLSVYSEPEARIIELIPMGRC